MSLAMRYWLIPRGSRNSSSRNLAGGMAMPRCEICDPLGAQSWPSRNAQPVHPGRDPARGILEPLESASIASPRTSASPHVASTRSSTESERSRRTRRFGYLGISARRAILAQPSGPLRPRSLEGRPRLPTRERGRDAQARQLAANPPTPAFRGARLRSSGRARRREWGSSAAIVSSREGGGRWRRSPGGAGEVLESGAASPGACARRRSSRSSRRSGAGAPRRHGTGTAEIAILTARWSWSRAPSRAEQGPAAGD